MAINPVTGTRIQRNTAGAAAPQTEPEVPYSRPTGYEFTQALGRGVSQVAGGAHSALGAVQGALGFEEAAQESLEEERQIQQVSQANYGTARVGKIEDIRTDDFGSFVSDATDFMQQLVGGQIPVLATMAAGGAAGGAVGALAGRAAIGATAGAAATSGGMQTGETFSRIANDPNAEGTLQEQAQMSLASGAVGGSLDALPVFHAYRALGATNPLATSLIGRAARAAVPQAGIEATTEAAQTLLSRGTHAYANKNLEVLGADGVSELLNAAVAGGILGGGMGAITGALQRPATDEDLINEVEADEVMNRVLLERRVEGLRGTLDDQTLDDFLSSPVVDDELLNELDSVTPDEMLDARLLDREAKIREVAATAPLQAIKIGLAGAAEGQLTRRETAFITSLIEQHQGTDLQPEIDRAIAEVGPEVADLLAESRADEDVSPQESLRILKRARENLRKKGQLIPAIERQLADTEAVLTEALNQQESSFAQEAQSLEDFERGSVELDESGRADANARTVNAIPAFRNVIRSRSGGFFTQSAKSIERLKGENPNSDYDTLPARQVIEAEMLDKFGPAENGQLSPQAQAWQDKLVADQIERRKLGNNSVDPNDPLSVFDGEVAIREVRAPNQFTGKDELAFTSKDFSGAMSEEVLQARAKKADENRRIKNPREREAAKKALKASKQKDIVRSNPIRPAKFTEGFGHTPRTEEDSSGKVYPREFLITVDKGTGKEETMAVQPEWAIKNMALKLYELKNGPRSTRNRTFESLNFTKEDIIEAFASVLTSLRTTEGVTLTSAKLPPDTVLMRDKRTKDPTLRVRDIIEKDPAGGVRFKGRRFSPKRAKEFNELLLDLQVTYRAASPEFKNELRRVFREGVPTATGSRELSMREHAQLRQIEDRFNEGAEDAFDLRTFITNDPLSVFGGEEGTLEIERDRPVADASDITFDEAMGAAISTPASTVVPSRQRKDDDDLSPAVIAAEKDLAVRAELQARRDARIAAAKAATAKREAAKKPTPKKAKTAPKKAKAAPSRKKANDLAQQALSKLAELNLKAEQRQFTQLVGRSKRWNKKLRMPGLRVANTVNFIEILAKRGDTARLQQIIDGTLQGASIGETVWVNPFINTEAQFEVLAHEMGHVLAHNTAPESHQQVFEAWKAWRDIAKKGKLKNAAAARRTISLAIRQFGAIAEYELDAMSAAEVEYVLDFEEWFADQVAETLINEKAKQGQVGGWMRRFTNKISILYSEAKADEAAVAPAVEEFIDRVIHTDVQATVRVKRAIKKDIRAAAAIIGTDPTTQYANKAVLAMVKGGLLTGKPLNALMNAFKSNSVMNRRVQDRIRPHSPAIAEQVRTDPATAVAYGYQLWEMGEIELGPASQTGFERFNDSLFRMLGEVSDMEQAKQVSEQVKAQVQRMQRQNPDADYGDMLQEVIAHRGGGNGATNGFILNQVVRDTSLQKIAQRGKEVWTKYAAPIVQRVFLPVHSRLLSINNAAITEIANRFWVPPGTQGRDEGYMQARSAEISRWQDIFARALGRDVTPELATEVLDAMQQNKPAASAEARAVVTKMRAAFSDIFDYATQAGVSLGKGKRDNYFPWVYDVEQLLERKDEWIAMMTSEKHAGPMGRILAQLQEEGVGNKEKGTFRTYAEIYGIEDTTDVADYFHAQLVGDEGYADTAVSRRVKADAEKQALRMDKTGHVPFVAALNERGLAFLQDVADSSLKDAHQSFLSKDLNQVLRVYTEQLVKRVEFHRRFKIDPDTGDTEIDVLLAQAKKLGATEQELRLAQDFVDAAQGTLGIRTNAMLTKYFTGEDAPKGEVINPKVQSAFSALILWQNVRTLALAGFTSLADPAGIMVRGGTLDTAFASLKAGFSLGNTDLHSTKVAEGLGIIDKYSIDQALASTYGTNFMTGRTRLWNERFFTLTGLQAITRVTRGAATGGALAFLKTHKAGDSKNSKRFLDELNLTADDIKLDADGNVVVLSRSEIAALFERNTEAAQNEIARDRRVRGAIRQFVDESILRPNAATRPLWASDPHFQLVFHLKSFMYTFHEVILKRMARELFVHGNVWPTVAALMWFVPLIIAADYLRDKLRFGADGDPKKANWGIMDYAVNGVERAGLPGLGMIMMDAGKDRQFGGVGIESFLGPTAGSAAQITKNLFSPDKWRNTLVDQLPAQNTFLVDALKSD